MGQTKQRGSFEERKAQAIERKASVLTPSHSTINKGQAQSRRSRATSPLLIAVLAALSSLENKK